MKDSKNCAVTQGQQPEALRPADEYEHFGFLDKHEFAKEEWCWKAMLELRRLHTENTSLSTGYDAARLEIKNLQAELVKESARTAAEKLRADKMTEQHRMQCNMRRELEEAPVGELCPSCRNGDLYACTCTHRAPQQPAQATQRDTLTREQIRAVFLANGFTIKEGLTDLKPYVYDAAYALLASAQAKEGGA